MKKNFKGKKGISIPRLSASIGTIDEEEQSDDNSSFPWMLDIGQN